MDYDFNQKYRTEEWYEVVKDKPLTTPFCIPSYNRPDAPVFKSKLGADLRPEYAFVFIRNTKEQYDLYKKHQKMVTLIPLPDHVRELGMTRESILQWVQRHGYKNLFMVDDRAQNLSTLTPALTRNGKLVMKPAEWSTPLITLKIWEYIHDQLYPSTVSYAIFHENSWYPDNINAVPQMSGFTEAYCLDVRDCKEYDIHYVDTSVYGMEDFNIIYHIMKAGLPHYSFTDIAYKEVIPQKMSQTTGSGAIANGALTREERILQSLERFMTKSVGVEWNKDTPGFRYKRDKEGKVLDIRFEWKKYWYPYYLEHRVK